MQKLRAFALFHLFEHGHQLPHVVAVHRTGVGEAEVIEQGIGADTRAVEHAFQPLLHFLRDVQRTGQFVEHFFGFVFDAAQGVAPVFALAAGKIFGESTHIGGNRHFVVVEDNQQIGVHIAGIVQRFKSLAGSHGSIADNGHAAVGAT